MKIWMKFHRSVQSNVIANRLVKLKKKKLEAVTSGKKQNKMKLKLISLENARKDQLNGLKKISNFPADPSEFPKIECTLT